MVGSKLLFPNDTIQHAGVVICQDGQPAPPLRRLSRPTTPPSTSRGRFQAVTAACMLVRRDAFEQAGGFDTAFRNCLEDADLCLRLGEQRPRGPLLPRERPLPPRVGLARAGARRRSSATRRLFRERWGERASRDDLDYYVEDGLLRIRYRDGYPLGLEVSPQLASVQPEGRRDEAERLLERSRARSPTCCGRPCA